MRKPKTWIAVGLVAALGLGVGFGAGRARAEEPKKDGEHPPLKALKHPLADVLAGSWTTKSTGMMSGTGKAAFALGIGGTALIQTYENTSAEFGTFHGHGVYRVSDDGKTLTAWWFDSFGPEPMKMVGPLTDTGYEIKGTHDGQPFKITFAKSEANYEFKMFMADQEVMKSVYTKAK